MTTVHDGQPYLRLVITPAPNPHDRAATALHVADDLAASNTTNNPVVAEAEQILRDAARAWQEVA